ncbi:hypothetical protein F5884DRAFT_843557 [Xylogone sp. PMI_703]|nr:hypothetical protein F5884DRAFT_843557 [Xylogone sp. PMI_703]
MASPSQLNDLHLTVPGELISLATLKYLGYDAETATQLWHRWINWPTGPPYQETAADIGDILFIDFVTGYLRRGGVDAVDDNDQAWHSCMNGCGISAELQQAIMDPVFRTIRLTESCVFWIRDTMKMRYKGLEAARESSRKCAMDAQRADLRPRVSYFVQDSQGSISTASGRSESSLQMMEPGISQDTAMSHAAVSSGMNASGSTILYKGVDQSRLKGLFDDSGNVVEMNRLLSSPLSDFLGRQAGFHFVADRKIAEYHACYAKRRDAKSSVVIPSPEWQNIVFHSRQWKKLPSELRKFKTATLIIGTISKKPSAIYQRMTSPAEITENDVLKTKDRRNGVQYAFVNDQGEDFLVEHAVWSLKVYPFTTQEIGDWYDMESSEPL